jgi:uncharacterized membrane protein YwzB
MMYPIALGSVKTSFLFLYKRVFSTNKQTQRLIVVLIALVAAWTVAFFFAEMFQCSNKFWANWGSTAVMRAECNETVWMALAMCSTDLLFDLIIILVPIPLVRLCAVDAICDYQPVQTGANALSRFGI